MKNGRSMTGRFGFRAIASTRRCWAPPLTFAPAAGVLTEPDVPALAPAWPGAWRGSLHLFGHTHGSLPDTNQSCDVGVDRWSYAPVTLGQIRERLAATPDIPEERRLGQAGEDDDAEG